MKKLLAVLAGIVAFLVGASIATAQTGSSEPPTDVPTAAQECPRGAGGVHGACVSAVAEVQGDDLDDLDDADEVEEPEAEQPAADGADNHGADVSTAAHECPHGPGGVHGACVSAVARDDDGQGNANGGGNGHGRGNDG